MRGEPGAEHREGLSRAQSSRLPACLPLCPVTPSLARRLVIQAFPGALLPLEFGDNRYPKASTGNVQLSPSEGPLMLALNLRPLRSPVPPAHGVRQGHLPSPLEDTSQQPVGSD